jgi:hypothetical protein
VGPSITQCCPTDRSTCQNLDVGKEGVLMLLTVESEKDPKKVEFMRQ